MRSHKPHSRFINAFSLIELSIVMAVFAVVAVGVFSTREVGQEHVQVTSIEETLDNVEQALTVYVKHHGYLPCPASRTDSTDAATYGVSVNCDASTASAAPAGTENIGTNTDEYQLRVGMIPTRTLGIPDTYALDAWGNRLTYAMIRTLGVDKATYDAYAPTQTSDYFQVVNKTGTVLYGNNTSEIINYVVLSHGPDGKGAYSKSGIQAVICPSNTSDAKNCNSSKQFVMDAVNQTATGTAYFNDFVRWKRVDNNTTPTLSTAIMGVSSVSIGWSRTCIITSGGKLQCSGRDWSDGELGNGPSGDTTSFMDEGNGFSDWIFVAGETGGACGIRNNGRAYCWGSNTNGQIGDGTYTSRQSPVEIDGNHTDWIHLARSDGYACGIRSNGRAYCWGKGGYGNLGDGTNTNLIIPTEVAGGFTDWTMLSVGDAEQTTCGLRSAGRIYCWGFNWDGNVGDSTNTDRNVPTEVAGGFTDWTSLGGVGGGSCAIRSNGRAYCWGLNDSGQVGDGTKTSRNIPTEVLGGFTDWKMIFKGRDSTCGIRGTGIVYCWGQNGEGELGTGVTSIDITAPVAITSAHTDFVTVRTDGAYHSCAIRKNGDLYCWGNNQYGAFGNGTTSSTVVGPTLIPSVSVSTSE